MINDFNSTGITNIFDLDLGESLINLQKLIYLSTKKLIIDHDENLELEKKIKLPFSHQPSKNNWSEIMNKINTSQELVDLINHQSIIEKFKKIFDKPIIYNICTFRARYPNEERVLYNWHQDEGTWFMSKDKNIINKYTATMWLSINGSNQSNSIQLIKNSHKEKLFDHKYIKGQGYFKAMLKKPIDNLNKNIITLETKPSQAIIFHPLTLHKSVTNEKKNQLLPRYSVDIRYFDDGKKLNYSSSFLFKLKKFINII